VPLQVPYHAFEPGPLAVQIGLLSFRHTAR
jgi:hypothetical protein